MRDYKGLKFHKLTLLSDVGPGGGTHGRIWMAACECGNALEVYAKDVAASRVRSCGKCPEVLDNRRGGYRARSADEARLRKLLKRTARKALRQGIPFALNLNDIMYIAPAQCTICPEQLIPSTMSLEIVHPAQGYTVGNIRPVCRICKKHMAGDKLMEYLKYLDSVINYLTK